MSIQEVAVWFDWGPDEFGFEPTRSAMSLSAVWLDANSGVFRYVKFVERPNTRSFTVFDGHQAVTQMPGPTGERVIRYEGSPLAVSRLAADPLVTAAFACARGEALPRATQARSSTGLDPGTTGDLFALPSGEEITLVSEVPLSATSGAFWLGETWRGAAPQFAATTTDIATGHTSTRIVYPTINIISAPRGSNHEQLVGETITVAGMTAVVAVSEMEPDGHFYVELQDSSLDQLGYHGNPVAGAGSRAILIYGADDHIVISGLGVDDSTVPAILSDLRRVDS